MSSKKTTSKGKGKGKSKKGKSKTPKEAKEGKDEKVEVEVDEKVEVGKEYQKAILDLCFGYENMPELDHFVTANRPQELGEKELPYRNRDKMVRFHKQPAIGVCLVEGTGDPDYVKYFGKFTVQPILFKPYTATDLLDRLEQNFKDEKEWRRFEDAWEDLIDQDNEILEERGKEHEFPTLQQTPAVLGRLAAWMISAYLESIIDEPQQPTSTRFGFSALKNANNYLELVQRVIDEIPDKFYTEGFFGSGDLVQILIQACREMQRLFNEKAKDEKGAPRKGVVKAGAPEVLIPSLALVVRAIACILEKALKRAGSDPVKLLKAFFLSDKNVERVVDLLDDLIGDENDEFSNQNGHLWKYYKATEVSGTEGRMSEAKTDGLVRFFNMQKITPVANLKSGSALGGVKLALGSLEYLLKHAVDCLPNDDKSEDYQRRRQDEYFEAAHLVPWGLTCCASGNGDLVMKIHFRHADSLEVDINIFKELATKDKALTDYVAAFADYNTKNELRRATRTTLFYQLLVRQEEDIMNPVMINLVKLLSRCLPRPVRCLCNGTGMPNFKELGDQCEVNELGAMYSLTSDGKEINKNGETRGYPTQHYQHARWKIQQLARLNPARLFRLLHQRPDENKAPPTVFDESQCKTFLRVNMGKNIPGRTADIARRDKNKTKGIPWAESRRIKTEYDPKNPEETDPERLQKDEASVSWEEKYTSLQKKCKVEHKAKKSEATDKDTKDKVETEIKEHNATKQTLKEKEAALRKEAHAHNTTRDTLRTTQGELGEVKRQFEEAKGQIDLQLQKLQQLQTAADQKTKEEDDKTGQEDQIKALVARNREMQEKLEAKEKELREKDAKIEEREAALSALTEPDGKRMKIDDIKQLQDLVAKGTKDYENKLEAMKNTHKIELELNATQHNSKLEALETKLRQLRAQLTSVVRIQDVLKLVREKFVAEESMAAFKQELNRVVAKDTSSSPPRTSASFTGFGGVPSEWIAKGSGSGAGAGPTPSPIKHVHNHPRVLSLAMPIETAVPTSQSEPTVFHSASVPASTPTPTPSPTPAPAPVPVPVPAPVPASLPMPVSAEPTESAAIPVSEAPHASQPDSLSMPAVSVSVPASSLPADLIIPADVAIVSAAVPPSAQPSDFAAVCASPTTPRKLPPKRNLAEMVGEMNAAAEDDAEGPSKRLKTSKDEKVEEKAERNGKDEKEPTEEKKEEKKEEKTAKEKTDVEMKDAHNETPAEPTTTTTTSSSVTATATEPTTTTTTSTSATATATEPTSTSTSATATEPTTTSTSTSTSTSATATEPTSTSTENSDTYIFGPETIMGTHDGDDDAQMTSANTDSKSESKENKDGEETESDDDEKAPKAKDKGTKRKQTDDTPVSSPPKKSKEDATPQPLIKFTHTVIPGPPIAIKAKASKKGGKRRKATRLTAKRKGSRKNKGKGVEDRPATDLKDF